MMLYKDVWVVTGVNPELIKSVRRMIGKQTITKPSTAISKLLTDVNVYFIPKSQRLTLIAQTGWLHI